MQARKKKEIIQNIKVFLYKWHDIFFYKHHKEIMLLENVHVHIFWVKNIYMFIWKSVTWTPYSVK